MGFVNDMLASRANRHQHRDHRAEVPIDLRTLKYGFRMEEQTADDGRHELVEPGDPAGAVYWSPEDIRANKVSTGKPIGQWYVGGAVGVMGTLGLTAIEGALPSIIAPD